MHLLSCILHTSFLFLYLHTESIYCERNVWAGCDSDVNMSDCDSDVNMCHVWWLDDVPRTVDGVYKVSLM